MRKPADWMSALDDRLLEYAEDEGRCSPQMVLQDSRIEGSRSYITSKMSRLAEAGLLRRVGSGIYEITEDGEKYLTGDLDVREMED